MNDQSSEYYLENFGFHQDEVPKQFIVGSPAVQPQNKQVVTLKAFNPYKYVQHLPEKEQQKYLSIVQNNKIYLGITHFINFDKYIESPEFFNSIQSQSEQNKDWTDNPLHLDELFRNQNLELLKKRVEEVRQMIQEVNNKTFESINLNHIVLPHFAQNFSNFIYLNSHLNFIKDLEVNMINFADQAQQRQNNSDLVIEIYNFWMETFVSFLQSIKRHSQKYTLQMVKKMKNSEGSTPSNYEGRSTGSSKVMDGQKRKPWKSEELQILQKIIQTNSTFNQPAINKVAEQLNRTPASISSKIQKIVKDKKVTYPDYEVHENMTILEKIINVLKNYPEGLSRQSVIDRINEHYQMGFDKIWQKSVAQILSSKPEFVRIKGTYTLNGQFVFDLSKKTYKDKVINCLLSIGSQKADLKRLVDEYIKIYGICEGINVLSDERRKVLEQQYRQFKLALVNLFAGMMFLIRVSQKLFISQDSFVMRVILEWRLRGIQYENLKGANGIYVLAKCTGMRKNQRNAERFYNKNYFCFLCLIVVISNSIIKQSLLLQFYHQSKTQSENCFLFIQAVIQAVIQIIRLSTKLVNTI